MTLWWLICRVCCARSSTTMPTISAASDTPPRPSSAQLPARTPRAMVTTTRPCPRSASFPARGGAGPPPRPARAGLPGQRGGGRPREAGESEQADDRGAVAVGRGGEQEVDGGPQDREA